MGYFVERVGRPWHEERDRVREGKRAVLPVGSPPRTFAEFVGTNASLLAFLL